MILGRGRQIRCLQSMEQLFEGRVARAKSNASLTTAIGRSVRPHAGRVNYVLKVHNHPVARCINEIRKRHNRL